MRTYRVYYWITAMSLGLIWGPLGWTVGFTKISAGELEIAVWYPTEEATVIKSLGPIKLAYTKDIPLASPTSQTSPPSSTSRTSSSSNVQKYEVILFSPGYGGHFRYYHFTGRALADQGYVVVAPDHQADRMIGGAQTIAALAYRVNELKTSLIALHADTRFADKVTGMPVHAIGYSLGGATVALGAGLRYDAAHKEAYCEMNMAEAAINKESEEEAEADLVFCKYFDWVYRWGQSWRRPIILDEALESLNLLVDASLSELSLPGFITGRMALIAPVTQGLVVEESLITAREVMIIGIDKDSIAKPHFHAQPLWESLVTATETVYVEVPGRHFSFMRPASRWFASADDFQKTSAPQALDEVGVISEINARLIEFFTR